MHVQTIALVDIPIRKKKEIERMESRSPHPYEHLKYLDIVFKVSERCNLKCDYCYFFFSGDDSWKRHPAFASLQTLEATAGFAADIAFRYGLASINFTFHGGEPLLLPKRRFDQMCQILRAHETAEFVFNIVVQTNAMLIDDDWIALFEKYDVNVGVSLDGPQDINDLHRFDKRQRSSYASTVAGLRKLQAASAVGLLSTPPGLLCVIHPYADGERVYRHFVDDLGVRDMHFLAPIYTHDSKVEPDAIVEVNRFLIAVLNEWLRDDDEGIFIRGFFDILTHLTCKPESAQRIARAKGDHRNIISVSSDGTINPEDALFTADPIFWSTGLNVHTHRFSDLLHSPAWEAQRLAGVTRPEACAECAWWTCCKGGRGVHRYAKANGLNNPSVYCEGLQELYTLMASHAVRSGVPMDAILDRLVCET